jgi:hypothetical protein
LRAVISAQRQSRHDRGSANAPNARTRGDWLRGLSKLDVDGVETMFSLTGGELAYIEIVNPAAEAARAEALAGEVIEEALLHADEGTELTALCEDQIDELLIQR